ncbi:hypothetical protein Micbo1qcDRAFT_5392 [Microdochium bolleyi]|uniref:Uncharacterized protein n=1 Tax=Microdochium bolleyi TaxID=196109 RepID=A0A136JIX0_9PEZI|nr:hypothetical protein Micbo1qcDRAFT_5392 [Microdochium bolleyi]
MRLVQPSAALHCAANQQSTRKASLFSITYHADLLRYGALNKGTIPANEGRPLTTRPSSFEVRQCAVPWQGRVALRPREPSWGPHPPQPLSVDRAANALLMSTAIRLIRLSMVSPG